MTRPTSVLVLGAGGMAGHLVATYLNECGHDVSTLSARTSLYSDTVLIDVNDHSRLRAYLDRNEFDAVVNCVGVLIEHSQNRPDMAVLLNAYLPHLLEHHFSGTRTKVIHVSTDCVFSGLNPPYVENALPDGPRFYDRSKALGEVVNSKDLTLRMSIVGPDIRSEGVGLFNWFAGQRGQCDGYTKAMWNGITTIELAKAIEAAIVQGVAGLYHLVPEESVSKYELLKLLRDGFGRTDLSITPVPGICLDKSLVNTRTDFDYKVADYPSMVGEMRDWVRHHIDLYPHYTHMIK